MDNIHAPTVASGPASGGIPRDLSKLSMPDLMQEKQRIEEELSALSSILQSVRSLNHRPLLLSLTLFIQAWGAYDLLSHHLRRLPS
jgi:hypothetical protein